MSVHYKFKSALDFDTISFDGLHISVADLKKAIIHQKRLGKTMDFDLQITNAQTKEEYSDDTSLIPKNTSLTIARVPLKNAPKKNWEPKGDNNVQPVSARKGHDSSTAVQSNVDLSTMNGTEEDKIREMIFQSTAEYDPTNYQKIRGASQTGEVPINYKCYRCNKPGHWIKNCPLPVPKEPMEMKRTSGIPRSFIERDKDPENNPIIQLPQVLPEEKQVIPEDLICGICKDLFTDAVMIPCCGSSFCDECVRTALLESEDNECPDCKEKGSSPGSLIPNRFLRNSVNAFRNETGYIKTARQTASNKQAKPTEEPQTAAAVEATPVISSTNITSSTTNSNEVEEGTVPTKADADTEKQPESSDHCDLQESYEEVSQHGDIGSPADDKAFDNESDYEDNITVTVPPAHLQGRGAYLEHYNGRPPHHYRYDTPPAGHEHPSHYNSGNSTGRGRNNDEPIAEEGDSHTPKIDDAESSYNAIPAQNTKHEYDTRSPDYHQPSGRNSMPIPPHNHHPHQPPMGGGPPHQGYMPQPHHAYPGPPHTGPHPYPVGYGMQHGYPPQRPYEHHGGMYHGERPRMMYPPRGGYAPHPPHMRPRHMAPMAPAGYPAVPNVGPGIIDDPLEAFNRIMREKERRKEQEAKQANRHRSPHAADRNRRSRSFDNASGNRRGRSSERGRHRSPRARTPERRRSPDEKHDEERDRDRDRERDRDRGRDRERDRDRERGTRRRNRSSSYSSSGSRSYSRSPATKKGKSPKKRSRSPYRERRSRSRSKSFEERRHGKYSKDRREDRREEHRGEYRDNRERSPNFNYSGYRGRGGGFRGGLRGRGGNRDGGYQQHYGRGYDRGHGQMQASQHDQYGHQMVPGPGDYHHHDPTHHLGVPPGVVPGGMSHGVPPAGHYAAPPQPPMQQTGAGPNRYQPRETVRGPYMSHPVKSDPMAYYDQQPQAPIPVQQSAPVHSEPPPPGFEEQDSWSGKQDAEYRAPDAVTPVIPTEDYHNTPKSHEQERALTPVIHDDRHEHMTRSVSKEKDHKKRNRDDVDEHYRREERKLRSSTPDRHSKEKLLKRVQEHDREKEKEKDKEKKKSDSIREKRLEKEKEADREKEKEKAKEREKESKRKQRDSSEDEKKEKKKDKEKKKRKKEKEAERKKHKKERKEKEKRAKESKKERKTVEKEEADSSLQPATPKHIPRMDSADFDELLGKRQEEVDTTQEFNSRDFDDTILIPNRSQDLVVTDRSHQDHSYLEEPSSSHQHQDQEQYQQIDTSHEHSDLYSDIPDKYEGDQLEKSILQGLAPDEETDVVNSSGVGVDDHLQEEIKRSDSILDLHANVDFEGELEDGETTSPPKSSMFIGIPELSKWELDEDAPVITSSERKPSTEEHISISVQLDESTTKVTNEVLKRAENAIFTRAINAIRPIEIKKISLDRQKLYSNDPLDIDGPNLDVSVEKQQEELKRFQVTVPTNDNNAERSVEIKPDVAKTESSRASPVRASIKERLGSKITEVRESSSSSYSHSRTPPPVRKVKATTSSLQLLEPPKKRSRTKSPEHEIVAAGRKARGERDSRRREDIRISSSSRRQDSARRVVVAVREPSTDRRKDLDKKERVDREAGRVKERVNKDVGDRNRDRIVRRSKERSREQTRQERIQSSPVRRDRERDRQREREREREKEVRRDRKQSDDRIRKIDSHMRKSADKSSAHTHKDDKRALERKRMDFESERRNREFSLAEKNRRVESTSRKEENRKRVDDKPEKQSEALTKPVKLEKIMKAPRPGVTSSDSSSSDSESSSSDTSSDSDEESTKKRKKRKHKKDRKRSKRSASSDSDGSAGKKKKKSKKSKSSKKKKKERKHRKE
ncbi:E3 ubiquitin-protein ligase RBBP6 [Sabethes cyaneus]|uniref:E3 ubiquitin-protein ligase RBBP6 n=1 Tax=Sabethes cyaneus TaxID=53552 RepID=UPI00237DEA89|nr:E3 ubiquitin-protein ligase RBBP6 [Sabethes cyaneus]